MSSDQDGFPDRDLVLACILAGGASRRMGRDKARLAEHGLPMVRLLAARLEPQVAAVRLVAKRDSGLEDLGIPMLYDEEADRALVHGIRAALRAPGPEWRFLLACDMPAIDARVLRELWGTARRAGAPGACARLAGRPDVEPLPALWRARLEERVGPGWGFAARDWVRRAGLAVWDVPAAESARFENVNTPEDWCRHLEAGSPPAAT